VRGEVCCSAHRTVNDVVENEDSRGPGDAFCSGWIERASLNQEKAEHGSVETEDGAGGSRADRHRMHPDADHASREACEEIDRQIAYAAEDALNERPDLVKNVHVEADVNDPEVQKTGREQTPVLMGADGGGPEVAAPVEYVLRRGLGERDAAGHHGEENQHIDRDQRVGDRVGAGVAAQAGGLGGGFGDLGQGHASIVLALCEFTFAAQMCAPGGQAVQDVNCRA